MIKLNEGMIKLDLVQAEKKFLAKKDFRNAFECIKNLYPDHYEVLVEFRDELTRAIRKGESQDIELLKNAYKISAKEHFEDYCIYTEWDKDDKFYTPRRKGLKRVVDALQRLADDETDILCISMPPGTGKTGIAIYFLTWLAGNNPKDGILGGSHNAAFLRGVYDECLREMVSDEYHWKEVFNRRIVRTNAQDMKIDVTELQRFSTLQFTSIGSGNAGKVRAIQLLYCDDLVEGIEEAMSPDRLDKKWQLYTTDLRQRKQGRCKELHIATRWSVRDVIGRIKEANENNKRAEFLSMPALNENGESNFDYGGSNGFSKEFYEDMRRTMDDASFKALYMNEPIEREGLLYQRSELRRFYQLPDGEPDGIIAVCDTAEGGGDDTVMPVGYIYGTDHYIYDVVCDDGLPEVTDHLCADAIVRNKVKMCQFESNAAGGRTADKVNELVKDKGWKCSISKKRTTTNKETKIIVNSAWVKEHCLFLDDSLIKPKSGYEKFINRLCTYSLKGKNKHDDVPDAMAQYSLFSENLGSATVIVGQRRF